MIALKCQYIPTPSEIRQACSRIQQSWSEKERRRRRVGDPGSLMIPVVDTSTLNRTRANVAEINGYSS